MPSKSDRDFVTLAVQKGFMSANQAREALVRLGQAEGNRAQLSVERLLLMEEMLDRSQIGEIQKAQARKVTYCVCGQKTNVFDFAPGQRVKCTSCGRVITIPAEV